MRKWIRDNVAWAFLVLSGISAVVTIGSWAVPSARDWMIAHPGVGWTVAFIAVFAFCCVLLANDRLQGIIQKAEADLAAVTTSRDTRVAELKQANREIATAKASTTELESERDELQAAILRVQAERTEMRHQRDRAAAALHPTKRDTEQFQELLHVWDPLGPLMSWLNYGFNARQWTSEEVQPLYDFVTHWAQRFFDEPTFNAVYEEFFENARALTTWMNLNAGWHRELNKGRAHDDPIIYEVADGDERTGGWAAFDALRDEALGYATALLEMREGLERVGRSRGL